MREGLILRLVVEKGNPAVLLEESALEDVVDMDSPKVCEILEESFERFVQEGEKLLSNYPDKEHRSVQVAVSEDAPTFVFPLVFLQFLNKYGLPLELTVVPD